MFEFHGWAVITVDDLDDAPLSVLDARLAEAEQQLQAVLPEYQDNNFSVIEHRRAGNGLSYLSVHGLHNHRYRLIIELFAWVAEHLPECYGLLFVRDDEDMKRNDDYSNCFRVWRLARGRLTEEADPFLSPCIPVIEAPYNFS